MINTNYNMATNFGSKFPRNKSEVLAGDLQNIRNACLELAKMIGKSEKPRVPVDIDLLEAGDVFISCAKPKSLINKSKTQRAVKVSVHSKDKKSGAFGFLNQKGPESLIRKILGEQKTPELIRNMIKSLEKQLEKAGSSEPKDLDFYS